MYLAVLLVIFVASVNALPNGAPTSVCHTMLPNHGGGIAFQTTPSPFGVSARRNGDNYMITVMSSAQIPFQGFMLQARQPNGELIGSFAPSDDKIHTINCAKPGDSLTHSNTKSKPSVEVAWSSGDYEGPVIFNATVAQDYETFWVGIESATVQVKRDATLQATSPFNRPTSTTPPNFSPAEKEDSAVTFDPFYEGCDVKKSCFGVPAGCVQSQNCKAVVAVTVYGERYEFQLKAQSPANWVGVGLSDDTKMGDDSVIECARNNQNDIKAYMSITQPRPNLNVVRYAFNNDIQLLEASGNDGNLYCRVVREVRTTVNKRVYDLAKDQYHILIAAGSSVKPNKVGFHDIAYEPSAVKKYLSDVSAVKAASKLLLRLHGAFMLAAWIGTASVGILLARYYRQTWVGKQICGKDMWFAWHRFFMVLTWCLTITGFILIFVELQAWSTEQNPHAILGTVTTILCFIQPIGAFFRPHPGTKNRPIFNWLHWLIGNSAHIVGIVTIFFAVKLNKAQLPEWVDWILVVYVVFHVITHLVLSIMGCVSEKSAESRISSFPMKEMGGSGRSSMYNDRSPDAPYSGLRKVMLALYMFIIIIIVIILIVIAVLAPIEEFWENVRSSM